MSYETPSKHRKEMTPLSPINTMEMLASGDAAEEEYDYTRMIENMKQGTFFNLYTLDSRGSVNKSRIFVYFRPDSSMGSLFYAPAHSGIKAPGHHEQPPASHKYISMKNLTDIWLGQQTEVLRHPSVCVSEERASHFWTLFVEEREFMNLEADTEDGLSEWLVGINAIMARVGRLLTKRDNEDEDEIILSQPPHAMNNNNQPTAVNAIAQKQITNPRVAELFTPTKPTKNQRRYSIQVVSGSKNRHLELSAGINRPIEYNTNANGASASTNTGNSLQLRKKIKVLTEQSVKDLQKELASTKLLVQNQLVQMKNLVQHTSTQFAACLKEQKTQFSDEKLTLVRTLRKERELRVRFMNQLIEEHGNIRVFVRVRPLNSKESMYGSCVGVDTKSNENKVYASEEEELLDTIAGEEASIDVQNADSNGQLVDGNNSFLFDKVFGPQTTQHTVSREVIPFVRSCLDGYNVCIFAYGQTGSGKTFTMEGTHSQPGVNYTAIGELFKQIEASSLAAQKAGHQVEHTVEVSVMEVYNEIPRDLLASSSSEAKLDIRFQDNTVVVPGLTKVRVHDTEEVRELLETQAKPNRSTAMTNMNSESSRSHCVLFVSVQADNLNTRERTSGKMVLVDLAGSERVLKSGVQGQGLKEAQNINKSLSALGDVIQALQNKEKHIPFRNSKLTFLLQDCLGGNAKCLMFCNVSPSASNQSETLCSLRFAARARNTQLGKAKKNNSGAVQNSGPAVKTIEDKGKELELVKQRAELEAQLAEKDQAYRALMLETRAKDVQLKKLMQQAELHDREVTLLKRQSLRPRSSMQRKAEETPRLGSSSSIKRKSLEQDFENDELVLQTPRLTARAQPSTLKRPATAAMTRNSKLMLSSSTTTKTSMTNTTTPSRTLTSRLG